MANPLSRHDALPILDGSVVGAVGDGQEVPSSNPALTMIVAVPPTTSQFPMFCGFCSFETPPTCVGEDHV
jgi:hypothetical protein